jgi:GAF domain-containing protein
MTSQLPLDELSTALARIKGLLLTEDKVDHAIRQLAQAAKDFIPGTVGAGVSLIDADGYRTSLAATDRVVELADSVQYELGQGPCLTAWAAQETVLIDDVGTDGRWPEWSAALPPLPIRSVLSTPLMSNPKPIGALKIYASVPSAYDDGTARLLELLAGAASTLLANIQDAETPRRISESLAEALHSRDTITRASGIIMERHGVRQEQAMQDLLNRARAGGTTLYQLCADVVAGVRAAQE